MRPLHSFPRPEDELDGASGEPREETGGAVDEMTDLRRQILEQARWIRDMSRLLTGQAARVDGLHGDLGRFESVARDLARELAALRDGGGPVERAEDLRRLSKTLADRSNQIASLEENNRALEEHSRSLEERSRALEEHGRSLEEHSRSLEEHSRALEERSRSLEEHGRSLEEERDRLQERNLRLGRQVELLGGIVEDRQQRMAELNADLYRYKADCERLRGELESARKKVPKDTPARKRKNDSGKGRRGLPPRRKPKETPS